MPGGRMRPPAGCACSRERLASLRPTPPRAAPPLPPTTPPHTCSRRRGCRPACGPRTPAARPSRARTSAVRCSRGCRPPSRRARCTRRSRCTGWSTLWCPGSAGWTCGCTRPVGGGVCVRACVRVCVCVCVKPFKAGREGGRFRAPGRGPAGALLAPPPPFGRASFARARAGGPARALYSMKGLPVSIWASRMANHSCWARTTFGGGVVAG
jgi:hypothetical protein